MAAPSATTSASDPVVHIKTVRDSIKELGSLVSDPDSDLKEEELPGLDSLIDDWYNDDVPVDEEQFAFRMLTVFKNSTHEEAYNAGIDKLPPVHKELVNAFLAKKITAQQAGQALRSEQPVAQVVQPPLQIQTSQIQTFSLSTTAVNSAPQRKFIRGEVNNEVFENWGRTVKQTPAITYYPENIAEIKTIVKDSVKNNRGVRVAGFRHSWAPMFGRDDQKGQKNNGDVMISTLTKTNATVLPNFTSLPGSLFQPKETELNHISVVEPAYVNGPALTGGKKYVRVGTATTNEQFRRWCIEEGQVTLPMNIIEVEITMGGSNATICHGAGLKNATLSDLVRCIEYVDVNGELRVLNMSDSDLMKAASGCFGLLGVVTHIVLECDAISTAVMRPMKVDVLDAIPPPPEMKDTDIPLHLRKSRTPEQKARAQKDFERRANTDYYAEWYWFPFSDSVWVNTWSTDASTKNVVNYPSTAKTFIQVLGTAIMNVAQNIIQAIHALQAFPIRQTALLSWLAMKNLDAVKGDKSIRTLVPNALHFQRGVQNIRVRNMEVEFPLHAKKGTTTERDYSNVQRAWWDAILTCYANDKQAPQRMPLEMRIMSGSEVTMAPQRGHKLGTCAIGILTLRAMEKLWEPYAQQVLDKWMTYKDNDGNKIVVRPHWAKEWDRLSVNGKPWRETLKNEVYKSEIAEFKGLLTRIGKKHGWTLADIKKTFSNDLLDYLYLDDVVLSEKTPIAPKQAVVLPKKVPIVTTQEVNDKDVHV